MAHTSVQSAPLAEAYGARRRTRPYRVKHVWRTLQGEGCFAGRPAVFVRFVGCNMWSGYDADRSRDAARTGAGCPLWCDTDFRKENSHAFSADGLVAAILEEAGPIRFCVLTGGEPLLQVDAGLIHALHDAGFMTAVETNGTVALRDACWDDHRQVLIPPDWIVCSPKLPEDRLHLECFDELKLVVPDYLPEHYAAFSRRARLHPIDGHPLPLLWLQPEDGPRIREATCLAIETALAHPEWRVSVQTHKVLDVP